MLIELREFITNLDNYEEVDIDFANVRWHVDANIRSDRGWYFFWTNTPRTVFAGLPKWAQQAPNAAGNLVDVKNYDLQNRAGQYHSSIAGLFSGKKVYSGYAQRLQARAREHTFPDPQTAGLALGRYPALHRYKWKFYYTYLDQFDPGCVRPLVVLKLGEQIWRAHFGWPILCLN